MTSLCQRVNDGGGNYRKMPKTSTQEDKCWLDMKNMVVCFGWILVKFSERQLISSLGNVMDEKKQKPRVLLGFFSQSRSRVNGRRSEFPFPSIPMTWVKHKQVSTGPKTQPFSHSLKSSDHKHYDRISFQSRITFYLKRERSPTLHVHITQHVVPESVQRTTGLPSC